jgi:hypothetical protein
LNEEAKRLEEIREAVEWGKNRFLAVDEFNLGQIVNLEDVEYLLKRVEEAEAEGHGLYIAVSNLEEQQRDLGAENERLRTFIQKVYEVDFGFLHYIEHLLGEDYSEFYRSWEDSG